MCAPLIRTVWQNGSLETKGDILTCGIKIFPCYEHQSGGILGLRRLQPPRRLQKSGVLAKMNRSPSVFFFRCLLFCIPLHRTLLPTPPQIDASLAFAEQKEKGCVCSDAENLPGSSPPSERLFSQDETSLSLSLSLSLRYEPCQSESDGAKTSTTLAFANRSPCVRLCLFRRERKKTMVAEHEKSVHPPILLCNGRFHC